MLLSERILIRWASHIVYICPYLWFCSCLYLCKKRKKQHLLGEPHTGLSMKTEDGWPCLSTPCCRRIQKYLLVKTTWKMKTCWSEVGDSDWLLPTSEHAWRGNFLAKDISIGLLFHLIWEAPSCNLLQGHPRHTIGHSLLRCNHENCFDSSQLRILTDS